MSRYSLILGIVATGRPAELARLLASLDPVLSDPDLHVVVLNNCGSDATSSELINDLVRAADNGSAGTRLVVRGGASRLPLHQARRVLADACDELSFAGHEPAIWMLDDDLAFEALVLENGSIDCRNVAAARVRDARSLVSECREVEVFVGGFSGDPPIRPEAVLAGQLTDLAAALRLAEQLADDDQWSVVHGASRSQDDYYDHAEAVGAGAFKEPRPWVPRAGAPLQVRVQRAAMLEAARGIPRGCTPFRPLLAASERAVTPVARANAGGNTLFRSRAVLRSHPWPSWKIGSTWTRRADMIGLSCMAGRHGIAIATVSHLSLRHDRTHQDVVDARVERWIPEFAGVLVSRAFDARERDTQAIARRANERIQTQLAALEHAQQQSSEVLVRLAYARPRNEFDQLQLEATTDWVANVRTTLSTLLDGRLETALRSPHILEVVHEALRDLDQGGMS